ncbi:MAG: YgiT-type zinc finger protein [Anaerolineae bacterium]|nr:MAG: YgiT-type zinc finger protein [Anaerolineae bacterium]
MTEDGKAKEPQYTCPECQAGRLRLRHVTYFTRLGGDYIAVPEFPAWVCDVCGLCEYDQRALSWLNVMLDANTGRGRRTGRGGARRSAPPRATDE